MSADTREDAVGPHDAGGERPAAAAPARSPQSRGDGHGSRPLETSVTSADGTRLAVTVRGPADAPAVVLVHGLGLSTASWGQVPHRLSDTLRVVAYDLRGHAQSGDAADGDYSLEAHARDLGAVLESVLDPGTRAVLVGSSLGGGIIVEHVRRAGTNRVAGVVLAGSGASGVTAPGFPARHLPRRCQVWLRTGFVRVLRVVAWVGRAIRPVDALADRIVRRYAFTPDEPLEDVRHVRDSFLSSRPVPLARTTLASVSHDGVRFAEHLTVPTLVVHGSGDPEVPDSEIRRLMDALPDGHLRTVPGAGHMLPLTRADVVSAEIARWVERVGPTTA